MDHTEEERRELEEFTRLSDKKAGPVGDKAGAFLKIINSCTKRVPRRRPRMAEVSDHL